MVLVLVLWAIAVLALVAGGLAFAVRQNTAVAMIRNDRCAARWLARAGVERAIAELTDDLADVDCLDDSWADNPTAFEDRELAGGTFSVVHGDQDAMLTIYGATDESAKLNLNAASHEQLMKLPDMTSPIASAIIDWRDDNEEPEADGIERSHYLALAHPYNIRNGPFRTVRELLLVRDVTEDLFYGEDVNLNGLLDAAEDDGLASDPPDNGDGRLTQGWATYLTVYSYERNVNADGDRRLNIKTADESSLAQRLDLEAWAAKSIIKAREQKQFEHLVDLLEVKRHPETAGADEDFHDRSPSEKDSAVTETMFKAIVDQITLVDDEILSGRININTAPAVVIRTLPSLSEETADAVIRRRDAIGYFESVGELLDVDGIDRSAFGKLENSVTIRSNVFRIVRVGRSASGLARGAIECVVDRGGRSPRILYWQESP